MKNNKFLATLSFKCMTIVSLITIFICSIFSFALFFYARNIRTISLQSAIDSIKIAIEAGGIDEVDFIDMPYYIDYVIYDEEKNILSSNSKNIPILKNTGKKYSEYHERKFYSDSDLKIAYAVAEIVHKNKTASIQCSLDIENDSLSKMIHGFPKILLLCIIPILAVSFLISYFISGKTVKAFKKLESAFEKEKAFSSNVSHELKTPVAIIDGHANLIKRWGKEKPEQLEKSVSVILEETKNMTEIIQTLLNLSKIENGGMEISKSSFYISNLFACLRDEFNLLHKEVKFFIEDEDFVEVAADERLLHQVLTAIISNSIKFSGEDCRIILKALKLGGKTKIQVIDNGPGFKTEIIPYVFEPFYKGDKSHTRNGSGCGLGLYIAKALIGAMDGKISAFNNPGGGAVMEIILHI